MRLFGTPAIWTARAVVSLAILAFACVDSQDDAPPPRAAVSNPAPTAEPTPTSEPEPTATAEPTPTSEPEPTAAPEPTPTSAPAPTAATEPTATAAPAAQPQVSAPPSDAADAFQSAVAAMSALTGYHADMEHAAVVDMLGTPGEFRTEIQADVQPPDKMGGDMAIALAGETLPTNGFVLIGDSAYLSFTDPDNPQAPPIWVPTAPADIADIQNTISFLTWFEPDSQYEFTPEELAEEDLDGESAYRIRGSFTVLNLPDGVEQPENMAADVWIGADDRLIRKVDAAGNTETIEASLEITVTYSRFNDPSINVEAP